MECPVLFNCGWWLPWSWLWVPILRYFAASVLFYFSTFLLLCSVLGTDMASSIYGTDRGGNLWAKAKSDTAERWKDVHYDVTATGCGEPGDGGDAGQVRQAGDGPMGRPPRLPTYSCHFAFLCGTVILNCRQVRCFGKIRNLKENKPDQKSRRKRRRKRMETRRRSIQIGRGLCGKMETENWSKKAFILKEKENW